MWLEKARALDELGRYENVLEVSERLLRLRPDDLDGWAEKAKALKGSGRHREAIETCRLALAIDKDRIDVGLIYASSLLHSGMLKDRTAATSIRTKRWRSSIILRHATSTLPAVAVEGGAATDA